MDIDSFCCAAFEVRSDEEAVALAAKAAKTGNAELRDWFYRPSNWCVSGSENIERWARETNPWMYRAVLIEKCDWRCYIEGRDRMLVAHDDPELLTAAEKRGLDARLWGNSVFCVAMKNINTWAWLQERRIDLTEKILSIPLYELRRSRYGSGYVECIRALFNRGSFELFEVMVKVVLKRICPSSVAFYLHERILDRPLILARQGIALRVLLSEKATRQKMLTMLIKEKFTASDFASAGLKLEMLAKPM
jgi:hypothetical protein